MLRDLVHTRFGINLTEQKRSLMVGRLQKHIQTMGYTSFEQYYKYLINDKSQKGLDDLINRISTNFSYFYRESAHFDFFTKTALPELIANLQSSNSKDVRIWTAGCSTGEEPYMLLMLMMEHLGMNYSNWSAGLLATDISDKALSTAKKAVYSVDRVSKVPPGLKSKYFTSTGSDMIAVKDSVKKELTLRRFNLMNKSFPFKKPFHMIFCRNVMIYFDKPTRDVLVKKFHANLISGGYLFIGHSETIGREQDLYNYVIPACYRKI